MITLEQAKDQLRVLHSDQDDFISDLIARALATIMRLTGDGFDEYAEDLDAAQLLLVEWWFYPDSDVELDEVYNLPRAVVALAVPYRTPTVA